MNWGNRQWCPQSLENRITINHRWNIGSFVQSSEIYRSLEWLQLVILKLSGTVCVSPGKKKPHSSLNSDSSSMGHFLCCTHVCMVDGLKTAGDKWIEGDRWWLDTCHQDIPSSYIHHPDTLFNGAFFTTQKPICCMISGFCYSIQTVNLFVSATAKKWASSAWQHFVANFTPNLSALLTVPDTPFVKFSQECALWLYSS